jgi:hypothetical protein
MAKPRRLVRARLARQARRGRAGLEEEFAMPLTGRFMFRRSMMGHIILQIEEDGKAIWPFSRKGPTRRRWRDANLMDLAAPEMRALIDLRHKPRLDLHRYYYAPTEGPRMGEEVGAEAAAPPNGAGSPADGPSRTTSH